MPLRTPRLPPIPLKVEYSMDRYHEVVISRIEIPYVLKSVAPDLRVDILVEPFLEEFNSRVDLAKRFKYQDYLNEAVCYQDARGEYHYPFMGKANKRLFVCTVCDYMYDTQGTKRNHMRDIHGKI